MKTVVVKWWFYRYTMARRHLLHKKKKWMQNCERPDHHKIH